MTQAMRALRDGHDGLELLLDLGWDRLLFPAAIGLALPAATLLVARAVMG